MIKIDVTIQFEPNQIPGQSVNKRHTINQEGEDEFNRNQSTVPPNQSQIEYQANIHKQHAGCMIILIDMKTKKRNRKDH